MSSQFLKGLAVLVPACLLIYGAAISFLRERSLTTLLQLVGAGFLAVVGFCHLSEALHLIPQMGWGLPSSLGHYIDLSSAILGLTLFPLGYLTDVLIRYRS